MIATKKYKLHSGGALGADITWEIIGRRFGLTEFNHYFIEGYKTTKGNASIKMSDKLEKVIDTDLIRANKTLKRSYPTRNAYVNNLLRRNWFQVNKSDSVFAISRIENDLVSGGTGWAVQMAIDKGVNVFVFCQLNKKWHTYSSGSWIITETPTLTENFAGIGTREIDESGKQAIEEVYKKTFESNQNKKAEE
jgi:hypothetical protein